MKSTRLSRAAVPPPDADAVIRVIFESARRSGVDISSSSPSTNTSSSSTSSSLVGSGGDHHHHHSPFSSLLTSSTSEAAKRQARNYALRVQKFREQQRKVDQSKTVPAATIQFSLKGGKSSTEVEEDDDPLANLFSSIDTPKVKQMTKPLNAPIKPIPSLFDQTSEQKQQQADNKDLPKVVVASQQQQQQHPAAKKGKRTPSPTRKYSSLPKIPTARTVHRSPSPGSAGAGLQSAFSEIQLDVPQLEIDPSRRPRRSSSPYPVSSSTSTEQQQQQQQQSKTTTTKTVFVAPHTTSLHQTDGFSKHQPSHHHQTISSTAPKKVTKPIFSEKQKEEPSSKLSSSEQTHEPSTTTTSFEAVSRPSFESSTSTTTASASTSASEDLSSPEAIEKKRQRAMLQQEAKAQEEQQRAAAAAAASLREQQHEDEAASATGIFDATSSTTTATEKETDGISSTTTTRTPEQQQQHTVEDWASLRAAELEQIKREREAAAQAEKEEKLAKEEKIKIDKWIESRKQPEAVDPLTHFAEKVPVIRELNDLYVAATWESAFSAFAKIHQKHTTLSQESLTHALSLAAAHTWRWPQERKEQIQPQFDAVSNRLRLSPATKNLFTMLLRSDEAASEKFLKMTNEERSQLPRFMVERYSRHLFDSNFQGGTWEANLQYLNDLKSLRHDPFMRLETVFLRSMANPRNMTYQPTKRQRMTEIVQTLEHQCRTKLSQLGRQHAVVLMYAFARLHAFHDVRRIFTEMKERNDLDEDIAAAYIRISNTPTIESVIPELRKSKINVLSSACTRAIVYSMCNRNESSAAIETIRAYATVTPAEEWSVQDLRAAVTACNKHMRPPTSGDQQQQQPQQTLPPDAGIVDTILNAALATWNNAEVACSKVTSFLILSCLTLGRTQDVLTIAKTICNPSNLRILDRLNEFAFDALNSTLASANLPQREPSEKRKQITADIQMKRQAREATLAQQQQQQQGGGAEVSNIQDPWTQQLQQQQKSPTPTATSTSLVPPQVSEKMLEHGRTRSWMDALALLQSLNLQNNTTLFSPAPGALHTSLTPQQQSLANSVTLLYNCAISAAVDHPETVDDLVTEMKSLKLQPNATTTNTIMTSLGKSEERWSEALDLFKNSASPKDISTYSVALSILGKRSQWEQATNVFNEMKKQPGMTKPTAVSFGLLIQAAHRENWLLTLRTFQDMIKMHGVASAREVVVNRVVKALDGANKTSEATKLLESLRKPSSAEGKSKDKKKNKK